jgi:hypothetical protein
MARTYKAPRKFTINGKAGRVAPKKLFDDPVVDQAIHNVLAKRKLAKLRKKDRRFKLAQVTALNSRPLNGH